MNGTTPAKCLGRRTETSPIIEGGHCGASAVKWTIWVTHLDFVPHRVCIRQFHVGIGKHNGDCQRERTVAKIEQNHAVFPARKADVGDVTRAGVLVEHFLEALKSVCNKCVHERAVLVVRKHCIDIDRRQPMSFPR